MNLPKITIRIEDREYCLDATDGPEILKMPREDRKQLITLLSAVKKQDGFTNDATFNQTPATGNTDKSGQAVGLPAKPVMPVPINAFSGNGDAESETGKSEVDLIMEGLIEQERLNSRRWRFSKGQWYVILGVISSVFFSLFLTLI